MQIQLFSTPGERGIDYIVEAARPILAGKHRPMVAYLPAASSEQRSARQARAAFRGLARLTTIDVNKQPLARILATLDQADLLLIPGGNTYLLAQQLHGVRVPVIRREAGAADMVTEIRQRILAGLPLVCFSAGCVLCGPDILTSNDDNLSDCTNFEGLDLLPFNLNVHFPDEPGKARREREERLQGFLAADPNRKVWALVDGAHLQVTDDAIRVMRGDIWEIAPGQPAVLLQPAGASHTPEPEAQPVVAEAEPFGAEARADFGAEIEQAAPAPGIQPQAPSKGEETMKTLLIQRHAKSSWKDDTLPDHDRPLNKRGKEDAPRMGKLLREQDLVPELILSSDARRTHQTTELIIEESGFDGEVNFLRDLYAAAPEAYIDALVRMGGEAARVMVVGHNPGLEELVEQLTGEYMPLPTAALAQVTLPINHWSDLAGDQGDASRASW